MTFLLSAPILFLQDVAASEYVKKGGIVTNELAAKLTIAVEKFELDYKDTLNNANVDSKTINVLYDLGADIKHLMDDVIKIVDSK